MRDTDAVGNGDRNTLATAATGQRLASDGFSGVGKCPLQSLLTKRARLRQLVLKAVSDSRQFDTDQD